MCSSAGMTARALSWLTLVVAAATSARFDACRDEPKANAGPDAGASTVAETTNPLAGDAGLVAPSLLPIASQSTGDASTASGSGANPPFVFSESPAANLIPSTRVRGVANGQPVEMPHVLLEATRNEWRVSFCEKPFSRPTDFVHGQAVHIYVREGLAVGKPLVHAMKPGGGYFAMHVSDPANADATVSWVTDHAYYLEITKLDAKPYDATGELVQVAGTASGRVYVAYKGGSRFASSGVAGTFERAVVRYYGKPFFME